MRYKEAIDFVLNKKEKQEAEKLEVHDFDAKYEDRNIYAVDGGEAVISDGGVWLISKIRTAFVVYNKNRVRESINNFIVANTEDEIKSFPETVTELPKKVEISEIPNHFRKIIELNEIFNALNDAKKKDIVLCDFLFTPENEIIAVKISELIKKADEKEVVLVGIGKTSRANIKGNSLIGFFNAMNEAKKNCWYCELEKPKNYFDVVAKLHPNSRYTYRINTNSKEIEDILSVLAYYSSDPAITGYPYPLIRADWLARVTDNEKSLEKAEISRCKEYNKILHDELSMNFHDRLDEHSHK